MNQERASHPHMKLTESIIGAAMAVHRALGPGLNESLYENALCLELTAQSLNFSQQQQFPVFYRDQNIGKLITDLIVENQVITEIKVASMISELHIAQTLSYLSISKLQVGLILNFKNSSLQFKRIANLYS